MLKTGYNMGPGWMDPPGHQEMEAWSTDTICSAPSGSTTPIPRVVSKVCDRGGQKEVDKNRSSVPVNWRLSDKYNVPGYPAFYPANGNIWGKLAIINNVNRKIPVRERII